MSIASDTFAENINLVQNMLEQGRSIEKYNFNLFDMLPCNVFVYGPITGEIVYLNTAFANSIGSNKQELSAHINLSQLLYDSQDIDGLAANIAAFDLLAEGESYTFDARLKTASASWINYTLKGSLMEKEEGRASCILFVAEDTTALVKTTGELHDHKELFSDSQSLLKFGGWTWHPSTGAMEWSDGIYELLGYTKGDLQETIDTFTHHIHPADVKGFLSCIEEARQKHSNFDCTYRILTKDTLQKTVTSKGKIFAGEDGSVRIMGIMHDVSEQVQSHQALVNYREMMVEKELFLNHGSWEYDLENRTLSASDGFIRLFGYDSPGDRPLLDFAFFNKHMTEEEVQHVLTLLRSVLHKQANYVFEFSLTDTNGEKKQIECYGKIVRGENDRATRIVGASRDVTRMRKYERNLEEKIQQLNRSNSDLEDFAYVASHDMQEPLRKIITFGDRIIDKYNNVLSEDGIHYLQRMKNAAANMRMLIDSLLEFSKLRLRNEPAEQLHLEAILKDVLNDLELKIEETGAIIESRNLPAIKGYAGQLKQLVMNLVNNAIKFTTPGTNPHIKITCSKLLKADKERYHLNTNIGWYEIQVSDNGIGFEQEHAQQIFQLFQRLHSKAEYAGSGIGLSICKKIVENHGGQIFATSTPGSGAVFTVLLPAEYNNL